MLGLFLDTVRIEKELEGLGLTPGESKVYVALLELGSTTVGPLVKRSGIAYSNIYEVLQRLIQKGLASFIKKGKVRRYQAASPSELQTYLENKEQEVEKQKEKLNNLLPRITGLQTGHPGEEAEIFIGFKGLKAAYEKLFAERHPGKEYLFIYMHEGPFKGRADEVYTKMWADYSDIPTRGLSNPPFRKSLYLKNYPKINCRFADFPLFGQAEVYGDQLLIISWDEQIVVNLVRAKNLADNFRRYFEEVWKRSRP